VNAKENVLFVFGILMGVIYAACGFALIFIPALLTDYSKNIKIGIGSVFIVYSFFRLYRSILKYKSRHES
jgi:cytochrome c biogenesis protein CcdA